MSQILFFIGAGASVDAGMPLVSELTKELRDRLPDLRDINGARRSEFAELFDALAEYEPGIQSNYERFFEWLSFLNQGQTGAFRHAVKFKLEPRLVAAVPFLIWSIKKPVWEILSSRHRSPNYEPSYFADLQAFLPDRGRLRVFTTNYDLCIEDACRSRGIDVVTGFDLSTKQWTPSLFRRPAPGINLYKLHGSLNWGLSDGTGPVYRPLIEYYPPRWDKEPEFILGPGSKLQSDDPFVALYASFHQAVGQAKVCVAIGHSFRDNHLKEPIHNASRKGLHVVDVNPSSNERSFGQLTKIRLGAKEAFEGGEIFDSVKTKVDSGVRKKSVPG